MHRNNVHYCYSDRLNNHVAIEATQYECLGIPQSAFRRQLCVVKIKSLNTPQPDQRKAIKSLQRDEKLPTNIVSVC